MAKKIDPPDSSRNCSEEDIVEVLINGAKIDDVKRMVVLFSNSKDKRAFSDTVGKILRSNSTFVLDRTKALIVQNNLLQANNTKVFLGLKIDEELLTDDYKTDQIKYYAKRVD